METSKNIWETEKKKLKELKNLRTYLKGKDGYLKNKLRLLEDRCRMNNICVKGIPGSENEERVVTEEKLRKVIEDKLDTENTVIERVHRVKCNNDNNDNNDRNSEPPTVVPSLLHFKDKQDVLHEA